MSSYKLSSIRKRSSDDDSSESDEEFSPPVKKPRNCNGESNIKKVIVSKYQNAMSWISELQVNSYFKFSMLRQSSVEVIEDEDDNEREVIDVPDDDIDEIAILTEIVGLDSQHNNQEQRSLTRGSLNPLPKPLSTSTPFYRDGSMVGLPSVPPKKKINGFHIQNYKSNGRSQIRQKAKKTEGRSKPLSNPSVDVEILLDSSESVDSADDLKIIAEKPLRKLPCSAFSRKVMSPIPVSSNDLGRSVSPCSSTTSKSGNGLYTADKVMRLKEKEEYKKLLDKMVVESMYRPVKTSETTAIQVDLTKDEHEEAMMGCCYNKEVLRKPIKDFMEKYYKPCQLVKKTITHPPKIEDETQENIPPSTSSLPEYRPVERKCSFFTDDWLRELKASINEETERRMEIVKQEERTIKRMKDRREAKLQEDKRLFDKYKVPGDVFPESGSGRDDYPELTPEMNNMVNAALQKFVGNENDELSTFNGVTVTRKHMLTLHDNIWLIDEVLNFYFNLIVERSKLDNYPSVYAFNTFFYTAVTTRGANSVLRWTRKVDIFSYDIIFVPLHLGMHWALCVVDNRSKTVTYCDSMGPGHDQCLAIVKNYLEVEMKAKKNIVLDPAEYSSVIPKDLPQQMNGSDCGMFTLKYAEYISRDAPITFKQAHMSYFRRRMVYEILTKQLM